MAPEQELDLVLDDLQRVIAKQKSIQDQRRVDWLPIDEDHSELRRRRRGSPQWMLGMRAMQLKDRYDWHQHYTGRRRNVADVHGEPVWRFETFEDRIRSEAADIFVRHRFCEPVAAGSGAADPWPELFDDVVATLLNDTAVA